MHVAANILSTKDGRVKLGDFGVATKLNEVAGDSAVVGSPYWMAPEVVEMLGASPASDIWSLGCTIIELMEGQPPYFKFPPMAALFRIVQDDHPPIPESCSPMLTDFLFQCFQRDPNLRVTAEKLMRHSWLASTRAKRTDGKNGDASAQVVEISKSAPTSVHVKPAPPSSGNQKALSIDQYVEGEEDFDFLANGTRHDP